MSGVPVSLTLWHLAVALKNGDFDAEFAKLKWDERIVLAAALIHARQGQPSQNAVARLAGVPANTFAPSKPLSASRKELIALGVDLATTLLGAHTGQTVGDLQAELTDRDQTIAEERAARAALEREAVLMRDYLMRVDDAHRPHWVAALRAHSQNVESASTVAQPRHLFAVANSEVEESGDDDE